MSTSEMTENLIKRSTEKAGEVRYMYAKAVVKPLSKQVEMCMCNGGCLVFGFSPGGTAEA